MVIGGSGNGEQIAANKVAGHPLRARLVGGDRAPGPRAQRRPGRLGRRPDAPARGHDPVRRGLPRRRRSAATSGTCAGSASSAATSAPASCRRCPSPRSAERGGRMPEGHTLHRLASALDDAFAGHPVRVSSPQGRFAESAALLDGAGARGRRVVGQAPLGDFADDLVHVHLGLYGRFDVHRDAAAVPAPVGQVRLRLVRRRTARRRTPTCAAPRPASCDRRAARRPGGPARPRPAARRTPTRTWPGTGSGAAGRRSPGC